MAGLIGLVLREPGAEALSLYDRLKEPMDRGGRLRPESLRADDHRWALGRFHLGVLQPQPQLHSGRKLHVLLHGELRHEEEARSALGGEQETDASGEPLCGAALVGALYRARGPEFAAALTGPFLAVIVDEDERRVLLVNDLLGSYPLYWWVGSGRLVFASELRSVLRDPEISGELDPLAVADFLNYGFLFGEKTLARDVRLLPASSTLVYRWTDGDISILRRPGVEKFFVQTDLNKDEFLQALGESFSAAVRYPIEKPHRLGLSLSGGLDSRVILSAVNGASGPIRTHTIGARGCADQVIAEKLSRLAGTEHHFLPLDDSYLAEFQPQFERMVSLTDGMYLSHGLTEMLALSYLEQADFAVLLRGHGGELAKASLAWPFHTDETIHRMRDPREFAPYFFERVRNVRDVGRLGDLFTKDWAAEIDEGARASLEESLADIALSPPDLAVYLYLQEHHRRFTVPSLELFRNTVEVRLPFVDEDFLALLLGAPPRWRDGTEIHRYLIGARSAELLGVRNSNTGAPGSAGPLAEMIYDKLNSVLKRLNVYGYRHYHSFDAWMQHKLIDTVRRTLLSPSSLERGLYHEESLHRLIAETQSGKADHAYLLQVLLILELWQEEIS